MEWTALRTWGGVLAVAPRSSERVSNHLKERARELIKTWMGIKRCNVDGKTAPTPHSCHYSRTRDAQQIRPAWRSSSYYAITVIRSGIERARGGGDGEGAHGGVSSLFSYDAVEGTAPVMKRPLING